MAVLHSELVVARGWLSADTFGLCYALARVTPGTNLLAFCAGIAWQMLGLAASVAAVLAVTVPAAAIALLLTAGYESLRTNPPALAAIGGTLAAAAGMMATGAFQLLKPHLVAGRARLLRALVIAASAFLLSFVLSMSPIWVLALAAITGIFWRTPSR